MDNQDGWERVWPTGFANVRMQVARAVRALAWPINALANAIAPKFEQRERMGR